MDIKKVSNTEIEFSINEYKIRLTKGAKGLIFVTVNYQETLIATSPGKRASLKFNEYDPFLQKLWKHLTSNDQDFLLNFETIWESIRNHFAKFGFEEPTLYYQTRNLLTELIERKGGGKH